MDLDYELEIKQQSTVRVFYDEHRPTKVVSSRSASKKLLLLFSLNLAISQPLILGHHPLVKDLSCATIRL